MGARFRIALGALFMFAVMTASTLYAKTVQPPPPDYFPLRIGYRWEYKTTNLLTQAASNWAMQVLAVEQDGNTNVFKAEITAGSMKFDDFYGRPAGWVVRYRTEYPSNGMVIKYDPIDKYLQNPLGVNASWEYAGKTSQGLDLTHTDKVAGTDVVVVPAGKFNCMRVETDTVQGGQKVHKTYWYANHVGLVKSITESASTKNQSELLKYTLQ